MERLAEILGSPQFLTELCEDEPAPWRDEMEALIALAEPDEVWRLRLIDRFNLGYSSFAIVYRLCTAAAASCDCPLSRRGGRHRGRHRRAFRRCRGTGRSVAGGRPLR